jgi:hypothetical protein
MNLDKISFYASKAIDSLFIFNPTGTALGVLIGILLDGLLVVFSPFLKPLNIAALKIWHLIAFGVFGMNILNYLKRDNIPKELGNALLFIEQQRKAGLISDAQAKMHTNALLRSLVEKVTLDDTIAKNRLVNDSE